MQLYTAFCALWVQTWLALVNADKAKIICYYASWSVQRDATEKMDISDIDPTLCTHLIYAYVGNTDDGGVRVLHSQFDLPDTTGQTGFEKLNALRKQNEKLKILVSTGGWNQGAATYSKIAADPVLRSKYVKNVVDFLLRHELDGFDVNWEWPNRRGRRPEDVPNYVLLLKEFRTSFDEHKLILSNQVEGLEKYARRYYDIPQISKLVDFISLGTYFRNPTDPTTGHSAPLYQAARETSESSRTLNINASVQYWLAQGAPAEKLMLGTRFFGLSYTLKYSAEHLPGSPASGPAKYSLGLGSIGYNEICRVTSQGGWSTVWDEEQRVPYSYAVNQWISFDNVRSLTEKAKYVRDLGLGGVMVWSIDTDDHRGECGEPFPLLNTLNCELRQIGCSVVSKLDAGTTSKANITNPDEDAKRICTNLNIKYVRHPQNCAKFWICQKIDENFYNAEPFTCGDGLYFDVKKIVCKSEKLVQCS